MYAWEKFVENIESTGAKTIERDHALFIELPKTVIGMRDLMFLLTLKPTPDECWLADMEGLESGNTIRVWWD